MFRIHVTVQFQFCSIWFLLCVALQFALLFKYLKVLTLETETHFDTGDVQCKCQTSTTLC